MLDSLKGFVIVNEFVRRFYPSFMFLQWTPIPTPIYLVITR
jgi:hypothetical protein